jgi:colicin import membrane protein
MAAATLSADALRPQPADSLGRGAMLALVAHGLLVVAIAFGVSWRTSDPDGVSAELWAAVPQVAAPAGVEPAATRPPPPPPPPPQVKRADPVPPPPQVQRDAQIAIEKEREKERKRLEQEAEREKREQAEKERADKAKAAAEKRQREEQERKAEDERLAKQREENLKRMMGQVGVPGGTGAPGATGNAARDAGPSVGYAGRIKARIKPNIVLTDDVPGNPVTEVEVRCAPDGTIVGRRIVKPSGSATWDEAVLRAIDRTEVLPRDVDGRVPGTILIAFRPRD